MNVEQNPSEVILPQHSDTKAIDVWLKSLWDRAKKAAELIARLRQEKADLEARVGALESELERLKVELGRNEEELRTLTVVRGEQVEHAILSNGEKEMLTARVRDLLARLEGYV
jgi:chromosome segregation ATPase